MTFTELIENYPTATGDWSTDCEAGRTFALFFLDVLDRDQNPVLLGHLVKEIIKRDFDNGISAGFFQRISARLLS